MRLLLAGHLEISSKQPSPAPAPTGTFDPQTKSPRSNARACRLYRYDDCRDESSDGEDEGRSLVLPVVGQENESARERRDEYRQNEEKCCHECFLMFLIQQVYTTLVLKSRPCG